MQGWGFWRDSGRWEELRAAYTRDGLMNTTWTVSTADEFVARVKESAQNPKYTSLHSIGVSTIEINGAKAIAETRMILLLRGLYKGVEVDVTNWGRTYDRFVIEDGHWRIRQRVPIYEKDRMDPVDPSATVDITPEELAPYPHGYRHVACLQAASGRRITPDLPTPGSASLARLYADGQRWLREP